MRQHFILRCERFLINIKKKELIFSSFFLVGVSGFEPEASWTRTKRDTKLRHTPLSQVIIMKIAAFVKHHWEICFSDGLICICKGFWLTFYKKYANLLA